MSVQIALCGNPNSGKTTLFNDLTGASQYVGNWPGVTVEKKTGVIKGNKDLSLTDLPGIYSLSPYSLEERIARDFLLEETPDLIINIVDASNLERNLYLTTQLIELGLPMIIALNMMDVVEKQKSKLDSQKLESMLGVPVVEIVALRGQGSDKLVETIQKITKKPAPAVKSLSSRNSDLDPHRFTPSGQKAQLAKPLIFDDAVEAVLSEIEEELQKKERPALYAKISSRWISVKLFEKDELVLADIGLSDSLKEKIKALEEEEQDDSQSIISGARYCSIGSLQREVLTTSRKKALSISDRIDKIITNKWLAFPIFILVIFLVYYISVSTVGTLVTEWTNDVFVGEIIQGNAVRFMEDHGVSEFLVGLVGDGIIGGVGAVLGFLPQIAILFLMLGFLEETGYMARIAFILDRVFRHFGLSGKSFIPMLIGTGCSVPGIMAARTIENESDRRMTAITTSFIPCGAKLPIIGLFAGAVIDNGWWVGPFAYFLGIFAVLFSGIVLKKTKRFAGDPTPFVMELPAYRLPTLKNLLMITWERVFSFIKKAGSIILLSSIIIWFLQAYGWDQGFTAVSDVDQSFLAKIGSLFAWLFIPLGFGSWQAAVAAVTGLVAKENIASTFGILFGLSSDALELVEAGEWAELSLISDHFSSLSGLSFLIFNLICIPCFAAVGAMHRELGSGRWTLFGISYQMTLAYSMSLITYQFGLVFNGSAFSISTLFALAVLLAWLYFLFRKPLTDRIK